MMLKIKTLFTLTLSVFFISCAMAPLTTPKTARSLGEGNWEIDLGATPSYLSVNRGFSENLDMGLTVENQLGLVFELSGKSAFINRSEEGYSLALFGGVFTGDTLGGNSSEFRLGPVLSYKSGWWEPYLVLTYNLGQWEWEGLTKDEDSKSDNSFIDESISGHLYVPAGQDEYRMLQSLSKNSETELSQEEIKK